MICTLLPPLTLHQNKIYPAVLFNLTSLQFFFFFFVFFFFLFFFVISNNVKKKARKQSTVYTQILKQTEMFEPSTTSSVTLVIYYIRDTIISI